MPGFISKKEGSVTAAAVAALIILAAGLGVVGYFYLQLQAEHGSLEAEYSDYRRSAETAQAQCSADLETAQQQRASLQTELGLLQQGYSVLEQDYSELNQSYSELGAAHATLDESFKDLRSEVDETIGKIREYERDIKTSMDWFNENSELDHDNAKTYLNIDCVAEEDAGCFIKTGCPWLVNHEKLGLSYKSDVYTSGETDKLQSLSEFVDSDGGDCEDYALFYKAEWNYMMSKCKSEDIFVESWVHADLGRHWLDWDKDWYLDNARTVRIQVRYPNVVCGSIYDFKLGGVSGHCVIAFTDSPIEDVGDMDLLDEAVLIEPQNGMYMGRINSDSGINLIMDGEPTTKYASYIFVVITDSDYFSYSEADKEWQSYSAFLGSLGAHRELMEERFWSSVVTG
ncbi:hypothetical protein KY362_01250 [Candidatus Woesearchaeota archaeon]|nr:hypothetical protein [Candidatus Woesearchaeota archaeon]